MVSFKGKFDQRSLSLFLLSLCFLVFVYGFLFLSVSLFSLVRRKLGKRGGYSTTMSGLPQYVAHLHNFLLLYNLLCCL